MRLWVGHHHPQTLLEQMQLLNHEGLRMLAPHQGENAGRSGSRQYILA